MPELTIRPFQTSDSPSVHRIAADTAFFGDPVEAYMEDRNLFIDVFYHYYTEVEAENGWVACVGQEVVGFLMGCTDTQGQFQRWVRQTFPYVAGCFLRGRYRVGRQTLRYVSNLALAGLRGEFAHTDVSAYPAHLHINIDAAWRGKGLGRRLIEAYLDRLSRLQIPGVHLSTTNVNEAACRLYTRMGFTLIDARQTHLWLHWTDHQIETRIYGQKL